MGIFLGVLFGVAATLFVVLMRRHFATFRAQTPGEYEHLGPEFDISRHLKGELHCDGVIFGPMGRVVSRFTATMTGTWDGQRGVLAERFHYDSGAVQERAWHLEMGEGGRFTARADDVPDIGRGRQAGPTVCLKYDIRLGPGAGGHLLSVVDWMYLVEDGTIINRSQFRKFGILVVELVATIRPKDKQ